MCYLVFVCVWREVGGSVGVMLVDVVIMEVKVCVVVVCFVMVVMLMGVVEIVVWIMSWFGWIILLCYVLFVIVCVLGVVLVVFVGVLIDVDGLFDNVYIVFVVNFVDLGMLLYDMVVC